MNQFSNDSTDYIKRIEGLSIDRRKLLASKLKAALGNSSQQRNAQLIACIKEGQPGQSSVEDLRRFARDYLPDHLIPQSFLLVEDIPRRESGKIDRDMLPAHEWQQVARLKNEQDIDEDEFFEDEFVAPSNELEQTLANIWSEVLGSGEISIHDNFLEVGGDSLLSIRILARINKAGLSIATEDFFEYPTIAEQARVVSQTAENAYDEGSTEGTYNLIPIQYWLIERIKIDPHHWNQTILLGTDESLDYLSLERALQKILLQHDVLRSVFRQNREGEWQQEILPLSAELPMQYIDLSSIAENQYTETIEQHTRAINRSMDLSTGPLLRLVYFETSPSSRNRLVIAAHHLIVDAESWRILLDDLNTCWSDLSSGSNVSLPMKTSSFKHWSEKLQEYAQSSSLRQELAYWQKQSPAMPLNIPKDFNLNASENTTDSTRLISKTLDKTETDTLLRSLPKLHKIEVTDALICALVCTVNYWTNDHTLLLDIEGHGRESLFDRVDISRTIGWFTTVFPVLIEADPEAELVDSLMSVKESLRNIPVKGIGYGVLRELTQGSILKQQANPQICFNYLGQIDRLTAQAGPDTQAVEIIADNIGQPRGPNGLRAYLIEVNARIENGRLHINWSYSDKFHVSETIENLAVHFNQKLRELLKIDLSHHVFSPKSAEPTSSFDLANLDQNELDAISSMLRDIDDNS